MPELPEVETVRAGLARHVLGRTVARVDVLRDYSVRRQPGGPAEFVGELVGRRLDAAVRRGKYLWLLLDAPAGLDTPVGPDSSAAGPPRAALMAHLGMSGQLLVHGAEPAGPVPAHLRVRIGLDDGAQVHFIDQRTFGHLSVTALTPTTDGAAGGQGSAEPAVPQPVAHIARDLLDPALDRAGVIAALRRRRTGVKRALLDQTLVSGVGNIYADEALWRARLHYARPTDVLRAVDAGRLLDAAAAVMSEALVAGGTSFDALYVNVNGQSGYFDRSLAVYGQEGRPCPRCGTPVRRDEFMNRSAYTCPTCQPRPRSGRW
ncbi:bifunctional DNA-formamidopyrimidine glycosylase/DNA-(apurinic or apyrimidinic site) lyase [Pengzhenrongella sicca]|uniref:Bifunctional DNA-formamidopyrimidine glycosylase/DNA-(Apurinic or apyrimidinic site) lyase n=1 Tax=Pengzhenrongella sicca TaxID=2819238 RepID=A0A8A4ZDT8_9MICO|nr:bifunctional DNA-formamidopyrimidine glycosylase/DNA-(apurinic or apyrimidinic site) lyase [Pengzhenrongella sicca]QTE28647.1 bifunctional DNA-formamidopyrimidine glycosylase/DNA-(apurinic or apyrimidinic site) lyase [Pengzhenrongella sicca]